ncbi:hypothetical protein BGY98DRAFT_953928 [Russula aff. rugulosa BPL654]|nr:hypothetical protein BGY98DRAFT_953928 [Russula aff. rugulosa BPL654]
MSWRRNLYIRSPLVFASWALLSGSPAVYAAPVPFPVGSTSVKRYCTFYECREVETPSESSIDTSTDVTPQLTDMQKLVSVLMSALQSYSNEETPSNTTTTVDLTAPEDAGDPSEPEPAIDAIDALLGDSGV